MQWMIVGICSSRLTPRYCLQKKKMLDQGAHAAVMCVYDDAIELH
jgi:hypothetical protein